MKVAILGSRSSGREGVYRKALKILMLSLVILTPTIIIFTGQVSASSDFSFIIIADPHINGNLEHTERLQDCIYWINEHKTSENIALVFVVGDIGYGNIDNVQTAKRVLDELSVPYLPLIGDNDIIGGDNEVNFANTFEPQYRYLSTILDSWERAPSPVYNLEIGGDSYFQNFAFEYDEVHFICLDWNSRKGGEDGDLHDFEGGTWGWFKDQVRERATGRSENIVMLSHHAMHHDRFLSWFGYGKYMFSYNEFETISSFTKNYGDHLAINFAGHYHRDMDYDLSRSSGYLVRVVDATHDDDNMIRLVHTTVGSSKISYSEENISVPHYEVPPRPPKPSLPLLPATMEYTLTILDSVGGTTDPNTGSYTYEENTEVTVTTIPDSDYSFDYWELNGEIYTQNPVTITMASDITLHAIFAEIPLPESSSEPELPTEPEPTEIYVASIDMDSIMTRRWWWRYAYAEATVTVYDTDNNPVEGVKVYGHWEGATDDEDSGLSDFKGQATLWSDYKRISRGITFTFVVESLEKDGYVYDPGLNVETSDSVTV